MQPWYRTRRAWNFEGSKTSGIIKAGMEGMFWESFQMRVVAFLPEGVRQNWLAVSQLNGNVVYAVIDNNFRQPMPLYVNRFHRYVLRNFRAEQEQFLALDDKTNCFY